MLARHQVKREPSPLALDLLKGAEGAAEYLGLPRRTIYNMVEKRTIPFVQIGRSLYFRKSELERALAAKNETAPIAPKAPKAVSATKRGAADGATWARLMPLLMRICEVAPEHHSKMLAKLKNYQRLGWPAGTDAGRGVAHHYTIEQAFAFLLAFRTGLPAARAVDQARRRFDKALLAAKNGRMLIFRPESAMAAMTGNPHARCNTTMIWIVAPDWQALVESGLWADAR